MKQGGFQCIGVPHFNSEECLLHVRLDFETTFECYRTCQHLYFTEVETLLLCYQKKINVELINSLEQSSSQTQAHQDILCTMYFLAEQKFHS